MLSPMATDGPDHLETHLLSPVQGKGAQMQPLAVEEPCL